MSHLNHVPDRAFAARSHGANPEKLYRSMGIPMPERVLDFSTNTNVLPWLGRLDLDLRRCLADYPDDEATELRALVARRCGCGPENVLFVNGSNEAIYLLASFFFGKKAALLQPVYGEYRRALAAFGAEVVDVFSLRELDGRFAAAFLCNPCNPTGDYIPARELGALARGNPATLFVVDQAYIDFLRFEKEDEELDFRSLSNLVLLRSLTKMYHLSGARIGYVLAGDEWTARLNGRRPTWSVNAVAQDAALAFLRDDAFVQNSRAFYAAETPRFVRAVEAVGFRVRPTVTNFFLVEVADDAALIAGLLRRGLVVRHTRNFPGLEGSCIRVATRLPAENDELVRALTEIASRGSGAPGLGERGCCVAAADFESDIAAPFVVGKGEVLVVEEKYTGKAEWADWYLCRNPETDAKGWTPAQILEFREGCAVILEPYSSKEMNVKAGDALEKIKRWGGWTWCVRPSDGAEGWVPDEVLRDVP